MILFQLTSEKVLEILQIVGNLVLDFVALPWAFLSLGAKSATVAPSTTAGLQCKSFALNFQNCS
jgi:hypothetical protein